jgi:Spy/CpxP family protein refolding chaperone
MLKTLKSSALILALAVAGTSATFAQTAQSPNQTETPAQTQTPGQHRQFHRREPNPEFETKMLTRRLNLSPEQASQIEPILAAQHESMKALKPAQSAAQPDFKAMREQRKAIMEDTKAKLDAVLTPEQREQFAKMRQHQFHGQHGDWTPRTNTPAPTA